MSATVEQVVTVVNAQGLHMRPADMLSRAAAQYQCQVEIEKDGQAFDCKSIMNILTLGATQGTKLTLRGIGTDADAAIAALVEMFERGFDESDSEVASTDSSC